MLNLKELRNGHHLETGNFLETAKKRPTLNLEELRNGQRLEIGNF